MKYNCFIVSICLLLVLSKGFGQNDSIKKYSYGIKSDAFYVADIPIVNAGGYYWYKDWEISAGVSEMFNYSYTRLDNINTFGGMVGVGINLKVKGKNYIRVFINDNFYSQNITPKTIGNAIHKIKMNAGCIGVGYERFFCRNYLSVHLGLMFVVISQTDYRRDETLSDFNVTSFGGTVGLRLSISKFFEK